MLHIYLKSLIYRTSGPNAIYRFEKYLYRTCSLTYFYKSTIDRFLSVIFEKKKDIFSKKIIVLSRLSDFKIEWIR